MQIYLIINIIPKCITSSRCISEPPTEITEICDTVKVKKIEFLEIVDIGGEEQYNLSEFHEEDREKLLFALNLISPKQTLYCCDKKSCFVLELDVDLSSHLFFIDLILKCYNFKGPNSMIVDGKAGFYFERALLDFVFYFRKYTSHYEKGHLDEKMVPRFERDKRVFFSDICEQSK